MGQVEEHAEASADRKGLTGEERERYIGGVFHRVRQQKRFTFGKHQEHRDERQERARTKARAEMDKRQRAVQDYVDTHPSFNGTKEYARLHKAHDRAQKKYAAVSGGGAPTQTARISVREHKYHGQQGYLISGRDTINRRISIFSRSRAEAERMRDDIKAGKDPEFDSHR